MAELPQAVNPQEEQPLADMGVMPAGEYPAMMSASDWKEKADKTGSYLEIEFTIIDGEFKDRRVWDKLTYSTEKGAAFSRRKVASISKALGIEQVVTDTAVFHDRPLLLKVGIEKGTNGYKDKNTAEGFKPYGAPASAPTTAAAPAASAAAPAKKPWE